MATKKPVESTSTKMMKDKPAKRAVRAKQASVKKPASAKKTPVAKKTAVAKKTLVAKKTAVSTTSPALVNQEAREHQIAVAAYLRAESRGFEYGGEVQDWLAAEQEVNARLAASP
jgi:hypothetical protein